MSEPKAVLYRLTPQRATGAFSIACAAELVLVFSRHVFDVIGQPRPPDQTKEFQLSTQIEGFAAFSLPWEIATELHRVLGQQIDQMRTVPQDTVVQ